MNIPGYQIIEELYSKDKTYVCRAIHLESQKQVVLKYLNREFPNQNDITKIQYEFDITKSLNLEGIVKVLSYEKANNSAMIVMEDTKSLSLKQIMDRKKIDIHMALKYSIQFCDILSEVHNKGVIHRDIKPHNLIVQPTSDKIQLIDFGIAVNYFENATGADEAIALDGTLAYISPEQTGRMNRRVDTRTDLYSLGVLFYEVLTGALPFTAQDSMGWVHCHIAKQPPSLSEVNPEVPEMLSAIVLKLMSKNAEDRYQTAMGLKYDLEKCLVEFRNNKNISPFILGAKDKNHLFRLSQKLYNREKEFHILLDCFDQAKIGKKQIALVSGIQGSGKSCFALELNKPLVEKGGVFAFGKFEAYKKEEPLAGFVQATKQWINNILARPQSELDLWKTRLQEALSANGRVITSIVPELEMIIGPQPELPSIGASEAENRFYFTFLNFFQTIACEDFPLVLILDDLDFADLASMKLIKLIYQNPNLRHLLLVMTFNSENEILRHLLDENYQSGYVTNLTMKLLEENHIESLIRDAVQDQDVQITELSKILKVKTGGNPFFLKDFLNHLSQKKLIRFDLKSQAWDFQIDEIRNQETTGNVVEVMLKKILNLPHETQELLKLASCVGYHFNLEHLQVLTDLQVNEIAKHLWPAVQEGLIQTQGNNLFRIKEMSLDTVQEILGHSKLDAKNCFSHERLHLAAYEKNEISVLPGVHWKIAKKLTADTSEKELDSSLNEILFHLNLGSSLIVTEAERLDLIQLNIRAGIKAKSATAYPLARQYFAKAIENLNPLDWENNYNLCLQLYNEAAIAAFLNHEEDTTALYTQTVLQKARDLFDKIATYDLLIAKHIANDQVLNAIKLGLSVLGELDIHLPLFPTTLRAGYQIFKSLKVIHPHLTEEKVLSLPVMVDPLEQARVTIMARMISCSYMLSHNLHALLELYIFESTMKNGKHPVSSFIVSGVAMIVTVFLEDKKLGIKYGNLALKMSKQSGTNAMESRIRFAISVFVDHFAMSLSQVIERFRLGEKYGLENGDLEYSFYCASIRIFFEFMCGDHLSETHEKCVQILKAISNHKQAQTHIMMSIMSQGIHNLCAKSRPQLEFDGPFYKDEEIVTAIENGNHANIFLILFWKSFVAAIFRKHEEFDMLSQKYQKYANQGVGVYSFYLIDFYFNLGAIRMAKKNPSKARYHLRSFRKTLNLFRKFANHQRENYQNKYFFLLAELYFYRGNLDKCLEYFEKTIQTSMASKFYYDQALAYERMGEIFRSLNNIFLAKFYIEMSMRLLRQWGCHAKVDQMSFEFEDVLVVGISERI